MRIVRIVCVFSSLAVVLLTSGCGSGGASTGTTANKPQQPAPPSVPQPLTISTLSLSPALVGNPYSVQLTATNGIPPLTWSASGLVPSGLKLSSSGLLSGIPSTPYCGPNTNVGATVKGSSTPPQTASISLPHSAAGVYVSLGNGQAGTNYLGSIAIQCSQDPVSWSLLSGSLPPGLLMQPFPGNSFQLNI
jgi:hypothetical protein